MVSQPPSPCSAVSSYPRQVSQFTPQKSNRSFATLSPGCEDEDAGLDEREDARPHDGSRTTIRNTPLDTDCFSKATTLIDPQTFDLNEPQKGQATQTHGRTREVGELRTDLQDAVGGKNSLRMGVRGTGPRKSLTYENICVGAENVVGAPNYDSGGNDGKR